jgi:hypothetical protein
MLNGAFLAVKRTVAALIVQPAQGRISFTPIRLAERRAFCYSSAAFLGSLACVQFVAANAERS